MRLDLANSAKSRSARGSAANPQSAIRNPQWTAAFTLLEIMVVMAIMGIVMAISIPTMYQQLHPESMRKAVSQVMEACAHARARAILGGVETDLVIHPADRQFDITTVASRPVLENRLSSPDVAGNEWRMPSRGAGGGAESEGAFSVRLSDKII